MRLGLHLQRVAPRAFFESARGEERCSHSCPDIATFLPRPQPSVVGHLDALSSIGLLFQILPGSILSDLVCLIPLFALFFLLLLLRASSLLLLLLLLMSWSQDRICPLLLLRLVCWLSCRLSMLLLLLLLSFASALGVVLSCFR